MSLPSHHCQITFMFLRSFLVLTILQYLPFVSGGICWYKMESDGYCKETLKYKVSKEKCCGDGSSLTAYTPDDLREDTIFLWRTLDKGVPCARCKETCEGVVCGKNRKCTLKNGKPTCVCSPKCSNFSYRKGPVCGTDIRSYKSVCRLKKQRCRTKDHTLKVNYPGQCRTTCENVKCKRGKYCIQDQYLNAHCVNCDFACSHLTRKKIAVCGDDGITYQSICHLHTASCYSGKSITIAYRDKCRTNATCDNVSCSYGEKCLINRRNGAPRCVSCNDDCRKLKTHSHLRNTIICGNNNQTYADWCDMISDSCTKGYVIEPQSPGSCDLRNALDYATLRKFN